jgi:uncharacterized protein (DUF983 family)
VGTADRRPSRAGPPSRSRGPGQVLRRGFLRRCPVCGQGHLFRHWLRMVPRCPRCAYRFHRAPGQWLGSWFLNVCLAQMVAVLFLIVAVIAAWPNPLSPLVVAGGVAATAAWVVFFFPFSRTIWCAIDLAMKPLEFEDDVAPGFELEAEIQAYLAEQQGRPAPRRDE